MSLQDKIFDVRDILQENHPPYYVEMFEDILEHLNYVEDACYKYKQDADKYNALLNDIAEKVKNGT